MTSLPRQVLECEDVNQTSLSYILNHGGNQVLWDTCQLIWDTEDLRDVSPVGENQMAVYGIRGIFEDRFAEQYYFQFRYMIDHGSGQPCYSACVSASGPIGAEDAVDVNVNLTLKRPCEERVVQKVFEDNIRNLTNAVFFLGVQAAIRLVIMSWKPDDGSLE